MYLRMYSGPRRNASIGNGIAIAAVVLMNPEIEPATPIAPPSYRPSSSGVNAAIFSAENPNHAGSSDAAAQDEHRQHGAGKTGDAFGR